MRPTRVQQRSRVWPALDFYAGGNAARVSLGRTALFDSLTKFTMVQIVYMTNGTTTSRNVGGRGDGAWPAWRYVLVVNEGAVGNLRFYAPLNGGASGVSYTSSAGILENGRLCIIAYAFNYDDTSNAGRCKLYGGRFEKPISEVPSYTAQTAGTGSLWTPTSGTEEYIGNQPSEAQSFPGRILLTHYFAGIQLNLAQLRMVQCDPLRRWAETGFLYLHDTQGVQRDRGPNGLFADVLGGASARLTPTPFGRERYVTVDRVKAVRTHAGWKP